MMANCLSGNSAATLFIDADGDALSIAVTGLPVWASYDAVHKSSPVRCRLMRQEPVRWC